MDKLRFNCRLNPQNPKHKKAWEILERQPTGKRTEFIIAAILAYGDKDEHLKELIAEAVKEGLSEPHMHTGPRNDNTIPNEVMGFLDSL